MASDLKYGRGSALWKYWTKGEGFAKWSAAVHKWTTLRDLLLKEGVPPHEADGLTTNIIQAVMPGYMKQAHQKGRSAMTELAERVAASKPYGDVPYADPGYLDADGNQASKSGKPGVKRYPLTANKVQAAWAYIGQDKNAGQYTAEQLAAIKGKIKAAMARFGHKVSQSNSAPADGEDRFNPKRVPAGSSAGGQFAPASGGSSTGKDSRPVPGNKNPVGQGETGRRVSDLQKRLNALGAHLAVDGKFGPKTRAAVVAFQKAHGLKPDGLVGPKTTAALRAKPAVHPAKKSPRGALFAPDLDVVRSGAEMELQPADDGSLGTLTGRFSEFGRWYRVSSKMEGDFLERVAPGATADTIRDNRDSMRVLFDHGMDAQIGNKVLGPIATLEERSDGPHYEVPLFDTSYNRDLLPGLKAGVYGASMRMRVTGDEWDDHPARSGDNPDGIPERTITRMRVMEFGPVTFPANPGASAGVRSGTDEFYYRMQQVNAPAFEDAVRAAGLSPEDFTGRDGARSAPGGEENDEQPGNGGPSPSDTRKALRHRAWLMREIR